MNILIQTFTETNQYKDFQGFLKFILILESQNGLISITKVLSWKTSQTYFSLGKSKSKILMDQLKQSIS